MDKVLFMVTKYHLMLLRQMNIGWQDAEFGAPEVDPKRPYGNSDVLDDMREILNDYAKGLSDSFLKNLHKETEMALQIALSTGTFKPGTYESEMYSSKWKLIEEASHEK